MFLSVCFFFFLFHINTCTLIYQLFHCKALDYFVCKSKPNLFNTSVCLIHCIINLMHRVADLVPIWENIVFAILNLGLDILAITYTVHDVCS